MNDNLVKLQLRVESICTAINDVQHSTNHHETSEYAIERLHERLGQVDAASCNQTMEEMSEELCSLRMQIKYQPSVTSNFVSILATKKYSLHAVYCYYRCTLLHIQYTAHTECLQSALLHDDVIHVHTCANLVHTI